MMILKMDAFGNGTLAPRPFTEVAQLAILAVDYRGRKRRVPVSGKPHFRPYYRKDGSRAFMHEVFPAIGGGTTRKTKRSHK